MSGELILFEDDMGEKHPAAANYEPYTDQWIDAQLAELAAGDSNDNEIYMLREIVAALQGERASLTQTPWFIVRVPDSDDVFLHGPFADSDACEAYAAEHGMYEDVTLWLRQAQPPIQEDDSIPSDGELDAQFGGPADDPFTVTGDETETPS